MRTNVTIGSFVPGKETAWERNVPVPCVLYVSTALQRSAGPASLQNTSTTTTSTSSSSSSDAVAMSSAR